MWYIFDDIPQQNSITLEVPSHVYVFWIFANEIKECMLKIEFMLGEKALKATS